MRRYTEGWIEQVGTARTLSGTGLAAALIQSATLVFASSGIEYPTRGVDTEYPPMRSPMLRETGNFSQIPWMRISTKPSGLPCEKRPSPS